MEARRRAALLAHSTPWRAISPASCSPQGYRTAILNNRACFEGKAVLDVGAGSGILAIWAAKAGARVVYAVEATSMAKHARRLAAANGVGDVVVVLEGYMEQVTLPEQVGASRGQRGRRGRSRERREQRAEREEEREGGEGEGA